MFRLHYIIAGAAKSSGLVSGAATQVILDTYVYLEHTTHIRMYVCTCILMRTPMYSEIPQRSVIVMPHNYMYSMVKPD